MNVLEVTDTLLQGVARIINKVKNITGYYTTTSLADVTKLTRVEPLTIVSKDCINLEYTPDIMQSLLSIFSAYYLQAVAMLTRVNDVEVVRILDRLNPDRDSSGFLLSDQIANESVSFSMEAYKHSLPTGKLALENEFDKDRVVHLNEVANLSVGKLLNVTISYNKTDEGGHKEEDVSCVTLPVSVRLMASIIPDLTITRLLAIKTDDNSLVERFHSWRSGRISFIRDLIFCQDMIDEYKKSMIQDESGTVQEIMRRVSNAKKYGLLTKNPSLVSASNIFVISEETARSVESKLGGKLSNVNVRNRAFENTYAMIIVVVDREWERVTFYIRGISAGADMSIKELKAANKNGKGGADITDILKSLQMGSSPF